MSNSGAASAVGAFFRDLAAQGTVLHALILREMQTRFGRDNIGILWLIVEPMMFATTVTLIHSVAAKGHSEKGHEVFPFTAIGYCLFIIFRSTFNRSEGAMRAATPLLYHRMVTPFDIMLASAIVDAIGCIAALTVLLTIGIMFNLADLPARPLHLITAAFLIFWLSFGLSLVVAAHTYEGHFIGRLVHPFSYAMVPLSGAFVTMTFLPSWARDYMAWNPMMNIFEMARYGQFTSATDDYVRLDYTIAVCASITYWGLVSMRNLRKKIHVG